MHVQTIIIDSIVIIQNIFLGNGLLALYTVNASGPSDFGQNVQKGANHSPSVAFIFPLFKGVPICCWTDRADRPLFAG